MSDRPWLEDGDAALRLERSMLKRLNAQEPPSGSADQGWAALAAEISGMQAAGSQIAQPLHSPHVAMHGAAAAGLGLAVKVAVSVGVAGGMLWAGSALLRPESASPSATPRHVLDVPLPSSRGLPPVQPALPAETGSDDAGATKTQQPLTTARPAASATTLVEEGRLLAKAHELIQAGQAPQALEVLRLSQARYPRSVLSQEREVLTIEALGATGNTSLAKQRAERFLKRYPNSPHVGRLERFVE